MISDTITTWGAVVDIKKDDYVRILDFLSQGKSDLPSHKRKPIAQGIGEKYFTLLEVSPKPGINLTLGERVYVGEGPRDKIDHIERRLKHDWLTSVAKSELPVVLQQIITQDEQRFVGFYNTCGIISPRLHKLETLPKIGKRHRQEILTERDITPFTSFEDMRARLKSTPDPVTILAEKIIEEIKGESKYYLFSPSPAIKE
ncbi:Uncharacterised protein [uncultured archaeon]|nr:Uncharacterised protein [uncultured archaeon]